MDIQEKDLRGILSANIKRYRGKRAWSQVTLAEKLDISANFLADIETGKSWVSSSTLAKLSNVLGVQVYQLFLPLEFAAEDRAKMPQSTADMVETLFEDISIALSDSLKTTLVKTIEQVKQHYTDNS